MSYDVNELIASEVTLVIGPKDWFSLAADSLRAIRANTPGVARVIWLDFTPYSETLDNFLTSQEQDWPQFQRVHVPYTDSPYALRNFVMHGFGHVLPITTAYTVFINNDCFPVNDRWLQELVNCAEETKCDVVQPLLLERSHTHPDTLHVWWKTVGLVHCEGKSDQLVANFDNEMVMLPFDKLVEQFSRRQSLLFLEDHCFLARTASFPPTSPLFDPATACRREFFDLAWGILERGLRIVLEPRAVVRYHKLSPLQWQDVPFFVLRRHDEVSVKSQYYLNRKWGIHYPIDNWQHSHREENAHGTFFAADNYGDNLPGLDKYGLLSEFKLNSLPSDLIWQQRLVVSSFVLMGFNRFRVGGNVLSVVESLQAMDVKQEIIDFWLSREPFKFGNGEGAGSPSQGRLLASNILPVLGEHEVLRKQDYDQKSVVTVIKLTTKSITSVPPSFLSTCFLAFVNHMDSTLSLELWFWCEMSLGERGLRDLVQAFRSFGEVSFPRSIQFPHSGHELVRWAHLSLSLEHISAVMSTLTLSSRVGSLQVEIPKLHTKKVLCSCLPRQSTDLTIVTQCSLDRLHHLRAMCNVWTGVIACAVLVNNSKESKQLVALHKEVERAGGCRLDLVFVQYHQKRSWFRQPPTADLYYPINCLRNLALGLARTDLVVLLDVDLVPSVGLQESFRVEETYSALWVLCSEENGVVVLPALEACSGSAQDLTLLTRPQLQEGFARGELKDFCYNKYENRGHGPSKLEQWLQGTSMYEVSHAEGYEPYIIVNRLLVPPYDERFAGYGKNKIVHIFHLFHLGFRFWVQDGFVVHLPHSASISFERTLGTNKDPHRLQWIKQLYEQAKTEICQTQACDYGQSRMLGCLRKADENSGPNVFSCVRKDPAPPVCIESVGERPNQTPPSRTSAAFLANWYSYAFKFAPGPSFHLFKPRRFISQRPRSSTDITIVSTCSENRLPHLELLAKSWGGVLAVAMLADDSTVHSMRHLEARLESFHASVERGTSGCRLDISLVAEQYSDHPRDREFPTNSMRNIALSLAQTELVLMLDIDLIPRSGLHDLLTHPTTYSRLHERCFGSCAVILPAFEVVGANHDTDSLITELVFGSTSSIPISAGAAEPSALWQAFQNERVVGFHTGHYPAGHGPCDFPRWFNLVQVLHGDVRSYGVAYVEGFEPYALFAREKLYEVAAGQPVDRVDWGPFDTRFRALHLDKISFFYHLAVSNFTFEMFVHPHAYLVDLPHGKSFAGKTPSEARACRQGLFERLKRELRQAGPHIGIVASISRGANERLASAATLKPLSICDLKEASVSRIFGIDNVRTALARAGDSDRLHATVVGSCLNLRALTEWLLNGEYVTVRIPLRSHHPSPNSDVALAFETLSGRFAPGGMSACVNLPSVLGDRGQPPSSMEAGTTVFHVPRDISRAPNDQVSFTFWIKFPPEFPWGQRGKLPGLVVSSGGSSVRCNFGWNERGVCAFQPKSPQAKGGLLNLPSPCTAQFIRGKWHHCCIVFSCSQTLGSGCVSPTVDSSSVDATASMYTVVGSVDGRVVGCTGNYGCATVTSLNLELFNTYELTDYSGPGLVDERSVEFGGIQVCAH